MSGIVASLHRKITGAGDPQSVVRTMKALAAPSIGQYEQSVLALADYYRTAELGWESCACRPAKPGVHRRNSSRPACRGEQVHVASFAAIYQVSLRALDANVFEFD
jgi:hypothetical protein